MGLVEKWDWANGYTRKQCKVLFCRMKAAVKKAVKSNGGGKRHVNTFRYDPWSYALNFDDGIGGECECCSTNVQRENNPVGLKIDGIDDMKNGVLVCVLLVK